MGLVSLGILRDAGAVSCFVEKQPHSSRLYRLVLRIVAHVRITSTSQPSCQEAGVCPFSAGSHLRGSEKSFSRKCG